MVVALRALLAFQHVRTWRGLPIGITGGDGLDDGAVLAADRHLPPIGQVSGRRNSDRFLDQLAVDGAQLAVARQFHQAVVEGQVQQVVGLLASV